MGSRRWLAVRKPVTGISSIVLKVLAFLIPLGIWCAVSYVPFIWHPMMLIQTPGDSSFLREGDRLPRADFAAENGRLKADGKVLAVGVPANPVFLPEPLDVAKAFYTAFTTEPARRGDEWLHESLLQSIQTIFCGFMLAALIGIPLGILCGTFDTFAKLTEPYVDFMRYMPPPVFGALMVAVFGIFEAPKIAIVFIGVFFNMVLIVANTTRTLDPSLLEAAQTLGAKRRSLITHVIFPGILPGLFRDLRILLGSAWTFLTVAELIGEMNGISRFINQQGKYRHFENVFAGIIMIGMIGLITDQLLAFIGTLIFPWTPETNHRARRWFRWIGFVVQPEFGRHTLLITPEEEERIKYRREHRHEPIALPGTPIDSGKTEVSSDSNSVT